MVSLLLLFACATEQEGDPAAHLPPMDELRLLSRLSLDLRGVRPTVEELERVRADASAIDTLIDEFMADPRFEERLVDIYSEIYLTRVDYLSISASSLGLEDEAAYLRAVGEEAPRIVARVGAQDLPYTEVVTGVWTMANEVLDGIWSLDYPDGSSGWQVAHYTDGRPAAGVLATNGLWWRYTSTDSNANRKRANQLSRILLCNDYLVRPIDFNRGVDLLDEEAVAAAVRDNPSCANCHNSLDPVAAYLFGFWAYLDQSPADVSRYHPDRELLWSDYLGVAPAWYGQPGDSLDDLGHQIAGDSRFPECAVSQVYGAMLRREVDTIDQDALTGHREAFVTSGLSLQALIRSVVSDPRYRAADLDAVGVDEHRAAPIKMTTPDLLASSIEDLTGFSWDYYGYEMLGSDTIGLRTLAGGVDGATVVQSARAPNATVVLVQERVAEAAARAAVVGDGRLEPGARRLFTEIDFTETPETDREAMVRQIQGLQLRVLGRVVEADGEEVEADLALWAELHGIEADPVEAWVGLLTALFRDPGFLLY